MVVGSIPTERTMENDKFEGTEISIPESPYTEMVGLREVNLPGGKKSTVQAFRNPKNKSLGFFDGKAWVPIAVEEEKKV